MALALCNCRNQSLLDNLIRRDYTTFFQSSFVQCWCFSAKAIFGFGPHYFHIFYSIFLMERIIWNSFKFWHYISHTPKTKSRDISPLKVVKSTSCGMCLVTPIFIWNQFYIAHLFSKNMNLNDSENSKN